MPQLLILISSLLVGTEGHAYRAAGQMPADGGMDRCAH